MSRVADTRDADAGRARSSWYLTAMRRWVKRSLQGVGAVVLLIVVVMGSIMYSAFGGMAAISDGSTPAPDVKVIKDGFVDVGVIDLADGKIALVDAGNDPKAAAILAELTRRQRAAGDVVAIFLTHGHPDHRAGCHVFPNAAVYAMQADIALTEGREGSHGPLTGMMGAQPSDVRVTRAVNDGEVVDVGGKSVTVYALPGHTAGSAAYLVSGVLFLGDSAGMSSSGKLVAAPWAFSDNGAQNRASLKALADRLAPQRASIVSIVPAHSGNGTFDTLAAFVP